jgi:hypothetical protein
MRQIFLFTFLLCWIVGCKSPKREIVDSFEEVNKSLIQSNDINNLSLDELYQSIKSKTERNSRYLSRADTIYQVANDAINFLEIKKEKLKSLDSVGDNLTIASRVLIKSPVADTVEHLLTKVYQYCYEMLVDTTKEKSIDSVMSSLRYLKTNKNWKHDYFDQTPTIAALTILSRFQNDCKTSAAITLLDIYQHMNK